MKSTSKKVTRPTTKALNNDPDPVGFGTTLAEIIAELKDAYHARLHAFLRRFVLVRFEPAVHRRVVDAGTNHGGPVSFPATITVYPRDATGFARVVGKLETPFPEPSDEHLPDEQPDDPEGVYVPSMFTGKPVWMARPKGGWRKFGRRR
jgi:hypothetical protein